MDKELLDLSGEDEEDYWHLKNPLKKGVTSFSGGNSGREKGCFNSSPLQTPTSNHNVLTRPPFSPIGRIVTGNNSMEQPSPSVDTENVGKENTSGNRFELPKLSVERQQMKKKKKNAGFNLRKSLAWDRAFSTDEGVLDPVELSKVTGNACQIGGGLLHAIHEEYRESMSASKCASVSPGLRALEENLFSDLPVIGKSKEKKIMSGKLIKYASPSKTQSSLAQKKVISAQDVRSSSKRSGCPRPPPSSSQKRPANVHTTNPQNRELGVSKVSTTKSDPRTVGNSMKRTTQSPSKAKQSQPTPSNNSHRNIGSVSLSKNTTSTKSKTKSSLASKYSFPKPSLKQARRNVHSVAGNSNVGHMTTSDVPTLVHASHNLDAPNVITMDTSLAQNSCSSVGNTQSTVSRLGKPSGLRVPSPSIGYFSQSNLQPSHSAGDKQSKLPRFDVCSASRVSSMPTYKKPPVAEKVPRVNSKAATGNIGSSGPAEVFSAQSLFLKPSQGKGKVDLRSTQEVESKVSSYCSLSSQMNESQQHPCITQGDTEKLMPDNVTICTSDKISTTKCEEVQSNSELVPSGCKHNVQEGNMTDDEKDEKRNSCSSVEAYCASPLKHGPLFKDSMDSLMQGPSGDELTPVNTYSQMKVPNLGGENICSSSDFSGDFDTLDVHGKPLNECVHRGNEVEISPCLSREKDAVIVYHSTDNVAKKSEVLDSFTADPSFGGDFASIKGDVDISSSEKQLGNTEAVFVSLRPAEALDCVKSPCNHLEENGVSSSMLCDLSMVCDGQAGLETEKRNEVSDNTETNREAGFTGPFPDCKDWFRESEEQQFSCQSVMEGKEGTHKIDVLTRNGRANKDDGPDMQIDYFTGSPDVEQNMEQVKLLMPSSVEVRMEDKCLELTSEKYMQYNGSSVAYTSDVKAGHVMKPTNQLVTSDGCSPAKDVCNAFLSYSNEELEDNSELEDMDLVTESDCSDVEPECNMESELTSDLDEFSLKGIFSQYLEVETIHTASDLCGETKTLLSESISSSASLSGDPEHLNEDTEFSKISEGMSKEDLSSGRVEHNYVGEDKIPTDTEKEVNVIKISPDHVAFATREEETGTPTPTNEACSVTDMQPNKFNVQSDGILLSESNGAHACESSSSCASEGKMILLDAKLEKKPDPLVVKPPNAVPFSDEWLAAIEAAGEEILTKKSGRVQHSPTEKSAPEPGPWSPVKKMNSQGIGPFDCTKYTNKGLPPALD